MHLDNNTVIITCLLKHFNMFFTFYKYFIVLTDNFCVIFTIKEKPRLKKRGFKRILWSSKLWNDDNCKNPEEFVEQNCA